VADQRPILRYERTIHQDFTVAALVVVGPPMSTNDTEPPLTDDRFLVLELPEFQCPSQPDRGKICPLTRAIGGSRAG
jgi:hypothetical protein